jgi:hypothetical protein
MHEAVDATFREVIDRLKLAPDPETERSEGD